MDTQKETQLVTSGGESRWFGFTPDDRRILMISGPDANNRRLTTWGLTAWDLDTMQPLWQRRILTGYQNYRPYAISPDGTAFAAVLLDGRVEVLETKDGTERFTIKTTEETAEAVMFSPDSSTLLTAAGYTDSTIRLWDARDGKAAGSLDGHHSFVSDLIFTPDGKLLISSSGDETIRLWDWATREPAGVLRGHLGEVDGLALAPDGRTLASRCKDGSIYLWDVTKPSRHLGYQKLPDRLLYYEATFMPDSQSILAVEQVGAEGGAVALWDAHTLKKTPLSGAESTNRYNITISGDARWVARKDAGGHIRVWDARSASESTNFLLAPASFVEGFTDNGKFLLTANRSAWALSAAPLVVAAWDTDTWRKVGAFRFTNTEGAFTPSLPNSFVIVADGAIRFFDVNKINEASRQIVNPPGNLNGLATSPDGRLAAGAYGSGHVRLWDLTTLQPVATLNGFLLGAHSVAFSPDGRRLAAASNGRETVKLWDSETLQEVLTLSGEGSLYGGLKFSADGRYLLAINEAGLALLWSAPTWAEIAAAEAKDPPSQSYRGQGKAEIKQP
jgi:WD40 repeat protein